MKTFFTKKRLLFLALASTLFFSCKKDNDETLDGDPSKIKDKEHVVLKDVYGITAIFPVNQWSNTYLDTMPENPNPYFDGFRYNAICVSLNEDNQQEEGETPMYATSIYLMRFHKTFEEKTECYEYIGEFKKRMYDDLKGIYYTDVIEHADTTIGREGYQAYHFTAKRGGKNIKDGEEDIYLMYKKPTLYGVLIKIDDELREASLKKCTDILPTVTIK